MDIEKVREFHDSVACRYPKPAKKLVYGTAGFRDRADLPLHSTCARMGLMAAMRSRAARRNGGSNGDTICVGVMITASHNHEADNGIKVVDTDGGMLSQDMEPFAMKLANAENSMELIAVVNELTSFLGGELAKDGTVLVGWDTRPHSEELMQYVCEGIAAAGGVSIKLGEVTTPQLHFAVHDLNTNRWTACNASFDAAKALQRYYLTLTHGFVDIMSSVTDTVQESAVVVDTSFGVGSIALQSMGGVMKEKGANVILDLRNVARAGPVNEGCGAELVQKGQVPPSGVSKEEDQDKVLCSFDGDADRIVFHAFPSGADWYLLDGDRIACLFSCFLREELQAAGVLQNFRFGCVQTAYANGGSTNYLRALGVPVVMAKTGVKFLHHAALEAFDVGVYFEANGHGTVLFSPQFLAFLRESSTSASEDPRSALALRRLRAFTEVINQAVGDAISDLLASLACLCVAHLNLAGWQALYAELPSRQLKCPSEKKGLIRCCPDETRADAPASLQPLLDAAMRKYPCGRCFVRPSGTEDVVRIYAEAETQADANSLADECVEIIASSLG